MAVLNLTSYKPVSGTSGDANQIANGFSAIETVVNALDNANIAAGANIDVSKIAPGSAGQVLLTSGGTTQWGTANAIPSGVLAPYVAAAAPSGWLLCDGTAVSRTTYSALFAIIGTGYGAGDGSTTFNVPDLRGRVPVGLGTNASVNALNANDGQAVANRRPQHRHTPHAHAAYYNTTGASSPYPKPADFGSVSSGSIPTSSVDGGSGVSTDALDAPSFIVVNYIIKT